MMLGVQKPVVKAHGSSDATAFFNAIRQARDCVVGDMIAVMTKFMQQEQVKKRNKCFGSYMITERIGQIWNRCISSSLKQKFVTTLRIGIS